MITLRPARPADAETIFGLIEALAVYEKEPEAVVCTAQELRDQMAQEPPPFECLIAELDGEAAGFALFFHNYSTWRGRRGLYLEDLFVRPEHRKKGIGRRLLSALAAVAVERGCARMEWAVLNWNELAIDFYRSLGAGPLDDWTTFRLTGAPLEALAKDGEKPE